MISSCDMSETERWLVQWFNEHAAVITPRHDHDHGKTIVVSFLVEGLAAAIDERGVAVITEGP